MTTEDHAILFEARRPFLTGLAYRILGSRSDAEDAVQDTFMKWSQADRRAIANPAGWLTTACTRRCIDMLRAARRARIDYVGGWLPEPIQAATDDTPESASELASSLSMAFLLLLERLAPKERAAFLLHDVFDQSYEDVAHTLGVQASTCRKLVSRARSKVGRDSAPNIVPQERQDELLSAFRDAITTGVTAPLAALMSQDIELRADSGGKAPAPLKPIIGRDNVLAFLTGVLGKAWKTHEWRITDLNGTRGALLHAKAEGRIVAAVGFASDASGNLRTIFLMRNPEKLARLTTSGPALR